MESHFTLVAGVRILPMQSSQPSRDPDASIATPFMMMIGAATAYRLQLSRKHFLCDLLYDKGKEWLAEKIDKKATTVCSSTLW